MNKIQKIAYLIGMMVLLHNNVFAMGHGSAGGMIVDLFVEMFKVFLISGLIALYLVLHFIYIIHGIKLWRNKENIINWKAVRTNWIVCNLFLLVVSVPFLQSYYETYMMSDKERQKMIKKNAELNNITLTQPQKIAGISMPAGTKIKTDSRIRRSKPEPDKFIDAEFPQPVMWYGIPIKRIERQLTGNQKWANIIIRTQPAQTIAIGQWLCDKNHSLGWLLQKESVDRISYHQSAEPYVYLYHCFLKDGQVVSLPAFQATFPTEALVRKNDPLTDVEQGLWLVLIDRFDKEKVSQAMNMDYYDFEIMVDSKKIVHNFLIKLNDAPEKHCGLPENTLLAWRKSEPDVIQVVSKPQYIPQTCWGKKLQMVSVDEMQKAMPQHNEWHFQSAKRRFEKTSAQ